MKAPEYKAKDDYVDGQATNYDAIRFSSPKGKLYQKLQRDIFLKILAQLPKGLRVLDLPCGTGRVAEVVAEHSPDILCADISEDMLGVSRKKLNARFPGIQYRILDAEKIDAPDGTFDLVTTIKLMHLLPYPVQATVLREIVRVSKRWIVVTYAYKDWMSWIKDYVFRKKYDETNPSSEYPQIVGELVQAAQATGCDVRGVYYTFRLFSSEVTLLLEKK